MKRYQVDEIRANQYMGTEYHDTSSQSHHVIFLCSDEVDLQIGDIVEFDEKRNVYKDGVMILDREKERAERMAWVEKRKMELSGVR